MSGSVRSSRYVFLKVEAPHLPKRPSSLFTVQASIPRFDDTVERKALNEAGAMEPGIIHAEDETMKHRVFLWVLHDFLAIFLILRLSIFSQYVSSISPSLFTLRHLYLHLVEQKHPLPIETG
ncbi:unnamed protein product [Cyclocybe aegerita]|uniref:Uncharacterized protein n=1 Tax=Cyclocybe aegerita TaxID=1973307 RepID=A0A8S0WU38_CYCAE|nr:unnamed protein product [Cyclocybe aegerita]